MLKTTSAIKHCDIVHAIMSFCQVNSKKVLRPVIIEWNIASEMLQKYAHISAKTSILVNQDTIVHNNIVIHVKGRNSVLSIILRSRCW